MGKFISKEWKKILSYTARGRKNRQKLISMSKTIVNNLDITKHVKRNRVYKLVYSSLKK